MELRHGSIGNYGDDEAFVNEVRAAYGPATSAMVNKHGVLPRLEAELKVLERDAEAWRLIKAALTRDE